MHFSYGIERRVFHDLRKFREFSDELPILMAEIERHQSLYAYDWQFAPAASLFLASARRLNGLPSPDEIEPPMTKSSWEIPMDVKRAIGSYVASQSTASSCQMGALLVADPSRYPHSHAGSTLPIRVQRSLSDPLQAGLRRGNPGPPKQEINNQYPQALSLSTLLPVLEFTICQLEQQAVTSEN
jgi:hypothetical protein